MLELIKGMNIDIVNESILCLKLKDKYKENDSSLSTTLITSDNSHESTPRIIECLESLSVFDQINNALDQVFNRSKTLYIKSIGDTIAMLKLLMKEPVSDSSHLSQLIQIVSMLLLIFQITLFYSGCDTNK